MMYGVAGHAVHGCPIRTLWDYDGHHPVPHTTVVLVLHSKPDRKQGANESDLF